ncbi:hypothetical protein Hypma_010910 [Hypsizygus marmoreus]|uniref:F-box domain-containing protein n=2 Tax=Hypsizygus marmoreus TaxID=39966 RepID=A0A369JKS1_HYPMA|nr:hypothetical protein Hypma_010910 [Hypsizygus marmoreus]
MKSTIAEQERRNGVSCLPIELVKGIASALWSLRPGSDMRILDLAQDAICRCTEVTDLTIVVHDIEDLFPWQFQVRFLGTIWTQLGPNLRKLSLDFTHVTFNSIWMFSRRFDSFVNLVDLEIHLAASLVEVPSTVSGMVYIFFTRGLECVKATLESLKFSSSAPVDLAGTFMDLGHFPSLKSLDISLTINDITLSAPIGLTYFLHKNRTTLQHLVMSLYPVDDPLVHQSNHVSYTDWVTGGFTLVRFTALKSLKLGLCKAFIGLEPQLNIIPNLSRIPTLVDFTVPDAFLTLEEVAVVLNSFGHQLKRLRLNVQQLSSWLFLLLAAKVPQLEDLDLTYNSLACPPEIPDWDPYVSLLLRIFPDHGSLCFKTNFLHGMRPGDYPDWRLQYLRIAKKSAVCEHSHYQLACMRIVAVCLSKPVILVTENECSCHDPVQHVWM